MSASMSSARAGARSCLGQVARDRRLALAARGRGDQDGAHLVAGVEGAQVRAN